MTDLALHYAPRTRSFTALWLLEELGVPYVLESFSLADKRQKSAEHLALNPMGKVPVVVDRGRAVPEVGAIAIYLSDVYRDTVLSPPLDDPRRPDFLRWCFFASAIIEPALGEVAFKWKVPPSSVAWGSFEQMLDVAKAGVEPGPFLLGDDFSACDVLVVRRTPLRDPLWDDSQRGAHQQLHRALHRSSRFLACRGDRSARRRAIPRLATNNGEQDRLRANGEVSLPLRTARAVKRPHVVAVPSVTVSLSPPAPPRGCREVAGPDSGASGPLRPGGVPP